MGRICKNTIFAKGKEKNMEEILKIDTVDQYNKPVSYTHLTLPTNSRV